MSLALTLQVVARDGDYVPLQFADGVTSFDVLDLPIVLTSLPAFGEA